jgi:hypothetical protein
MRGNPARTTRGVVVSKETGVPVIAISASPAGGARARKSASCRPPARGESARWFDSAQAGLNHPFSPEIADWDSI